MDVDLQILALDKLIKDGPGKTARANVKAGSYAVDFTARVTGSMKVAPDRKQAVKTQVDYKQAFTALCWTFVQNGLVHEQLIGDVIRDVMAVDKQSRADIVTAVDEAEAEVTSVVRHADRKGNVTTRLEVEFVEVIPPADQVCEKIGAAL
ncbi:MAG: hypothetical protein ACXAC5_02350 [Promethearchaeota archaeon]|jgi:hypothetical protein